MSQQEEWRQLLDSGIKGDLVVLFRKNPGIIDTLDGVSRRLGVTPEAIEVEVSELVSMGFLKKKRFGNSEVIYLDEKRDREIQESATRFLMAKVGGTSA